MVVLDTSILIPFLRGTAYLSLIHRLLSQGRLVLCSVVAEEILAGARDATMLRRYRAFFQRIEAHGAVAAPSHEDWVKAGELVARYAWRWGALEPRQHVNDALIVMTAHRLRAELLTDNLRHMRLWASLLSRGEGRISMRSPASGPA